MPLRVPTRICCPHRRRRARPFWLCLTLGASACGLLLLLYGRFYAASDIPTVIGVDPADLRRPPRWPWALACI